MNNESFLKSILLSSEKFFRKKIQKKSFGVEKKWNGELLIK